MVLVEPDQPAAARPDRFAVPLLRRALPAKGLGADIDNHVFGHRVTDHRGGDEQRDLVLRARAEPQIVQVVEDVLPRPDLGDRRAIGELNRWGRSGADHFGVVAYRLQR